MQSQEQLHNGEINKNYAMTRKRNHKGRKQRRQLQQITGMSEETPSQSKYACTHQ